MAAASNLHPGSAPTRNPGIEASTLHRHSNSFRCGHREQVSTAKQQPQVAYPQGLDASLLSDWVPKPIMDIVLKPSLLNSEVPEPSMFV